MEGNEIRIEPVSPPPIESDSKGSAEPAMRKVSPKNGRKVIPFKRPKKDAKEGA
ncbi:MAG: hypothetical protein JRF08_04885 [Deltaproteobacteria bacterium]|nr:hypothetical protein [Deltaproteobacteria bacterium]